MAEFWQQWMPFHIDRWRGSLHVQGMPAAAKTGYLYLLAAQWQSVDSSLPNDDYELQILSSLTQEEWARLGTLILRRFTKRADGKLANAALATEWTETKHRWEAKQMTPDERELLRFKRSEAGKAGARSKWQKHGKKTICHALAIKVPEICHPEVVEIKPPNGKPMANAMANDGLTEQNSTEPIKKQIPSRAKREASDPRHTPFRSAVEAYARFKGVEFSWNGSEAKALADLLSATPSLTLQTFQICLNNRAKSTGTPHGERPRVWLPNILRYQQGPLNEFNRTGETNGKPSKIEKLRDTSISALALLERMDSGSHRGGYDAQTGGAGGRILEGTHS